MMHFSLRSLLFTSTTCLGLGSAADLFFDGATAPDPDSTDVETSKTDNLATKASCTPTVYTTPRTFALGSEPGPHCSYNTFVDAPSTSADQNKGKNKCTKDARCRAFSWFASPTTPDVGNCWLAAAFYNPALITCDNSTNSNTYLAVYNVSNWAPPNPLLPNGDFERGCFKPWFFQDFTSDGSMKKTVVNCAAGDCAPQGGARYVKITGNGANGDTRDKIDAYIGQQPALTDGVKYELTAQIRGGSGEFRFTYPVHTSVVFRGNATTGWSKIEAKFTGYNVGTFLVQMDAPEKANFAIDNVKIVQL